MSMFGEGCMREKYAWVFWPSGFRRMGQSEERLSETSDTWRLTQSLDATGGLQA